MKFSSTKTKETYQKQPVMNRVYFFKTRLLLFFLPMSNCQNSTIFEFMPNCLLDQFISFWINSCSSFICKKNQIIIIINNKKTKIKDRKYFCDLPKIRIWDLLNKARAKQINWRWPTEKLEPPSVTSWSNPFGRCFPKIKGEIKQIIYNEFIFYTLKRAQSFISLPVKSSNPILPCDTLILGSVHNFQVHFWALIILWLYK